ncbi:MAG: aspartate racemase [Saprospiraceae bacterium]|nr:MAG: aspartate racemase [Saprospiraceae bacterium]
MKDRDILGVVGGMGPIASAEFVSRVYQKFAFATEEQEAPCVIQYSDPTIPDRTTHFLQGQTEEIYNRLLNALTILDKAGATQFVICCFTIHHIVPLLPIYFRNRLISLVDVALQEVANSDKKYLFLSTTGARKMRILEANALWPLVEDQICFLSDQDQVVIHDFIYSHLKLGHYPYSIVEQLLAILDKYDVSGVIAGCTEIHLLTGDEKTILHPFQIIDPLNIIACHPFGWIHHQASNHKLKFSK